MTLHGETKRAYQREWVRKRREAFFEGKTCVKCGSTERLELDHIDRSTKVSHNIWSWSESRREVELAKCQVLCYDCHKAKSVAESIQWLGVAQHGTQSKYTLGCRCDACRVAHNFSTTQWKKKQRELAESGLLR